MSRHVVLESRGVAGEAHDAAHLLEYIGRLGVDLVGELIERGDVAVVALAEFRCGQRLGALIDVALIERAACLQETLGKALDPVGLGRQCGKFVASVRLRASLNESGALAAARASSWSAVRRRSVSILSARSSDFATMSV